MKPEQDNVEVVSAGDGSENLQERAVAASVQAQPMKERFADLLRCQREQTETRNGDPYMVGLYNGMAMMCANIDGDVFEPLQARRWISADERLPELYTEVLVWPYPSDYCNTAQLDRKGWFYGEYVHHHGHEDVRLSDERVTHWMPLPSPPVKEGE